MTDPRTFRYAIACRRGFATVIGVAMVAVVSMTLVALTWRFKAEATDARAERLEAELRQLLLAGGEAVVKLVSDDLPVLSVVLPDHVAQRGGAVALTRRRGGRRLEIWVEITARLEGRSARQSIRYVQTTRGWGPADATLSVEWERDRPARDSDAVDERIGRALVGDVEPE